MVATTVEGRCHAHAAVLAFFLRCFRFSHVRIDLSSESCKTGFDLKTHLLWSRRCFIVRSRRRCAHLRCSGWILAEYRAIYRFFCQVVELSVIRVREGLHVHVSVALMFNDLVMEAFDESATELFEPRDLPVFFISRRDFAWNVVSLNSTWGWVAQ